MKTAVLPILAATLFAASGCGGETVQADPIPEEAANTSTPASTGLFLQPVSQTEERVDQQASWHWRLTEIALEPDNWMWQAETINRFEYHSGLLQEWKVLETYRVDPDLIQRPVQSINAAIEVSCVQQGCISVGVDRSFEEGAPGRPMHRTTESPASEMRNTAVLNFDSAANAQTAAAEMNRLLAQ